MKITSASYALLSAVAVFAIATPVKADGSKTTSHVIGIQDSQTGAFRPLNIVVPDASTTTPTTGTVEVTFNIKLVSTFAKGTLLQCSANLTGDVVSETTATSTFYGENATEGVDISGTTATCSAKIPYSWLLPASSSSNVDSFSGSYSVAAVVTTTPATGLRQRSSSGSFVSTTKIPASGSTSKYTVNVTL
jgi:hypothetical protein